jgi:hypothetical protein
MNVRHVIRLALVSGLLAFPVGGFLLGLMWCPDCGWDLVRRCISGLWLALMTPSSFGFPSRDFTGNEINAWPWILATWVGLYMVLERLGRASSGTARRLLTGLVVAPMVFLLVVAVYQVKWGGRPDFIVAWGVFAYLVAVIVGGPVLWVLLRTGRTDVITMATAGAAIAGAGVGIFAVFAPGLYELAVGSRVDVVVAVLGGAIAGLALRQIAGLGRRDASPRESNGAP